MFGFVMLWVGCAKEGGADAVAEGKYADTPGTVQQVGDLWTVVPDADTSTRLCLDSPLVTDDLKVEGAKVVFSGKRGQPPENARMACNPVELKAIALAK